MKSHAWKGGKTVVLVESTRKETRKGGDRVKKWLKALIRRTNGEKGVTLIELLAVIVIIAVIAAIAVPVVLGAINRSKVNTAKQDLAVIAEALNRYAFDHNDQFPIPSEGAGKWVSASSALTALMPGSGGGTSNTTDSGSTAYLQSVPQDPWGNDFYYYVTSDGKNFELETATAQDSKKTGVALYMSNKMSAPTDKQPSGGDGNW
jgi:type II secretion system protein G